MTNQNSSRIVHCQACGAANRIPVDKIGAAAKCGKCHAGLQDAKTDAASRDGFKIRCSSCGAKNKIPGDKIEAGPKCGKCGSKLQTDELFVPQPIMVTDANFEDKVLKSPLPVLLFAWAPWCPTCGTFLPIIDEFGAQSKGKVRVGKVNIDSNPMLAQKFSILSVPYLFIFDNGQVRESMPGGLQKHELMMKMAPYI